MKFRAVVGLDFPPNRRVEAGEIVVDVPPKSVKWLREQGLIEPADEAARKAVVSDADPDEEAK